MNRDDVDAGQLMALAAWALRGLLDESHYDYYGDSHAGRDDGNPPLTIRCADGELLRLCQGPGGQPVLVDDKASISTPIDPDNIKGSLICALRAADERAVDGVRARLHEIADAREHADRTYSGIVLFSKEGKRLCDWSVGIGGDDGLLFVRCEPVHGCYTSGVGGWRASGKASFDAWLKALATEFDEPR